MTRREELRRIGIVASSFPPLQGGAEKQCLAVARRLESQGQLAWVLTQHIDQESKRAEDLDGVVIRRVGVVASWRRLRSIFSSGSGSGLATSYEKALGHRGLTRLAHWFKRAIGQGVLAVEATFFIWRQRKSVTVILCFFCSPLEAIVCKVARHFGIAIVVRPANSREYLFQDLIGEWQRASLLAADRVVAISTSIGKELLSLGVEESRVRVIPNGVDLPAVRWKDDHPHPYSVACVANISQQPLKGLDVLLEAWAQAVKLHPGRLVIYGRGNPTSLVHLARALDIHDSVEFAGRVDDVTSRLLTAEIFVLPSRVEGMSNALLEAMSLGMPCVATAVSGSVDLIQTGRNGLLVEPGDPSSLALAIVKLLRSSAIRAQFGRAARESIERNFTTEMMIMNYLEVLAEVDRPSVLSVPRTNSGVRVSHKQAR